jgi:hypothetical protein
LKEEGSVAGVTPYAIAYGVCVDKNFRENSIYTRLVPVGSSYFYLKARSSVCVSFARRHTTRRWTPRVLHVQRGAMDHPLGSTDPTKTPHGFVGFLLVILTKIFL